MGYVGLPLAAAFAKKFDVVGYDIDKKRIQSLKDGNDTTLEVQREQLDSIKSNIHFTSVVADMEECSIYIITVPLLLMALIDQI